MYQLSMGEYLVDDYQQSMKHKFFVYALFCLSTFMITITMLNMLIAIMSNTFGEVWEDRENQLRLTKLQIMGDYVHLINRNDDSDFESGKKAIKDEEILYVVMEPNEDSNEDSPEALKFQNLKREIEMAQASSEQRLQQRIDFLLDR